MAEARRRLTLILLLAAASLLLAACDDINVFDEERIDGSGDLVTRSFELDGFDAVDVGHTFEAEVRHGAEFSVSVSADDNLMPLAEVEVRGSTLHLNFDDDYSVRDGTLRAEVTMPDLRRIRSSGASHATFAGFPARDSIEVGASGASSVEGAVDVEDLEVDVSGASRVELSGTASEAEFDGSGASRIEAEDLVVGDIDVSLSGASNAEVFVEGLLEVDLSGASRVVYGGTPRLGSIDLSGGSSLDER